MSTGSEDTRARTFRISVAAINILDVVSVREKEQKSELVDKAIKGFFKDYSHKPKYDKK